MPLDPDREAPGAARDADDGPPGLTHWEGEPVAVWEALWEIPRLEAHERLRSTNDRLKALARSGASGGTVVVADEQTAGRGRGGRPWSSAPGLGLWISILLELPAAHARLLAPLLLGVAVCRAIERVAPEIRPALKWPNDVLLKGRKVCGVLCEVAPGRTELVVAGIGLNVGHVPADFPSEIRTSAVSLAMAAGRSTSRSELAGELLREVRRLLARPSFRLEGPLAAEVEDRDALRGRRVRVEEAGLEGRAEGIGPDGALRVATEAGATVRVVAGSVRVVGG